MKKILRENYIFNKKCLLILLYLYYLNDISYDSLEFRNFGFHFDPTCNFKVVVTSKKEHIHKYVIHNYLKCIDCNLEEMDVMGNVNIIRVDDIKDANIYKPKESLNIYFDEANFEALGFVEGKYTEYVLIKNASKNAVFKDELLYYLNNENKNVNASANNFILWLLRLYSYKLPIDLVMGAGINMDYGAKDWEHLVTSLNLDFYKDDEELVKEIQHYVGSELFVSSKIIKTNGFDVYDSLNSELYLFKEAKSFNDPSSTLYNCVDFIQRHCNEKITVITYNYDTNFEYLLRKRGVSYNTVFDDTSFISKRTNTDIFHVHGLLPYEKTKETKYTDSLIFNESEYFFLYNNPYSWNISKQLHDFTFNCCIFIGISLTDPNMKRLLELASNYLKFNFIFMKKEKGYSPRVYRDVTNYFFTYDLITIWIDEFSDINEWLKLI